MNDVPKKLTDYTTFYETLMNQFDAMATIAKDKLQQEKDIADLVPLGKSSQDENLSASVIDNARDAFQTFASSYCQGSYSAQGKLIGDLRAGKKILVGDTTATEDGYVLGNDNGVGAGIGDIYAGLRSWTNTTGNTFRDNYVSSINSRVSRQVSSIDHSIDIVTAARQILVSTRESALDLIKPAKSALLSYEPWVDLGIGTMKVIFTILSLVVEKRSSGIIVAVAEKALPEQSGLTVADLMRELTSATKTPAKEKTTAEKSLKSRLDKKFDTEADGWADRVCLRPAP